MRPRAGGKWRGWVELIGGDDGVEDFGAKDIKGAIESNPSCKYLGFDFKGKQMEVFTL